MGLMVAKRQERRARLQHDQFARIVQAVAVGVLEDTVSGCVVHAWLALGGPTVGECEINREAAVVLIFVVSMLPSHFTSCAT